MKKLLILVVIFSVSIFSQNYWQQVESLEGGFFNRLSYGDGILFAVPSYGGGFYFSTDNGVSWTQTEDEILSRELIEDVAVDSSGNIYVGTYYNGVFISRDNMSTWEKMNIEEYLSTVQLIECFSQNEILIVTRFNTYYSNNGGNSWIKNGIPSEINKIEKSSDGKWYAATDNGFYSTDSFGASWTLVETIPSGNVQTFILIDENNILVNAFVDWYKSTDGGNSWTKKNYGSNKPGQCYEIIKTTNNTLYTVMFGFVYKSTDGGDSWSLTYQSSTNQDIRHIVATNNLNLFITFDNGIGYSYNGGATFQFNNDFEQHRIVSLTSSPDRMLVNVQYHGMYYSDDNSQSWTNYNPSYVPNYTKLKYSEDKFYGVNSNGVRYSGDGLNWFTYSNTSGAKDVGVYNNNIFYCTSNNLYKSQLTPINWQALTLPESDNYSALLLNDNNVYCVGSNYLFYSNDIGVTWQSVQLPITNITVSDIQASGDGYVFISCNKGLLKYDPSQNTFSNLTNLISGASRQLFKSNEATELNVNTLLVDPKTNSVVVGIRQSLFQYEGNDLVFISYNCGDTWQNISNGFTSLYGSAMNMDSTGTIFFGTDGDGLFKSNIKFYSLSLSENNIEFGKVKYNNKDTLSFTIRNSGYGNLELTDLSLNNDNFEIINDVTTIPQNDSIDVQLVFTSLVEGIHSGEIIVSSNSLWGPDTLQLSAECIASHFIAESDSVIFSPVFVDSTGFAGIKILNDGSDVLYIDSVTINNSLFSIETSVDSIGIEENNTITFAFSPDTLGNFSSEAIFYTNAASSPDKVILYGEGAYSHLQVENENISIANLLFGDTADTVITISNSGNVALEIYEINTNSELLSVLLSSNQILPGFTSDLTVSFTPDSLKDFEGFIEIISTSITSPDTVFFNWTVQYAELQFDIHEINFGSVLVGDNVDSTITLRNIGSAELFGTAIFKSETNFSVDLIEFQILPEDSISFTIYAGTSEADSMNTILLLQSNAYNSPDSIMLSIGVNEPVRIIDEGIPTEFNLSQNYPNPFNPTTTIEFAVPELSDVSIILYNMLGAQIKIITDEVFSPGKYRINLDASELSSGVYFYKMVSKDYNETRKLILLK